MSDGLFIAEGVLTRLAEKMRRGITDIDADFADMPGPGNAGEAQEAIAEIVAALKDLQSGIKDGAGDLAQKAEQCESGFQELEEQNEDAFICLYQELE